MVSNSSGKAIDATDLIVEGVRREDGALSMDRGVDEGATTPDAIEAVGRWLLRRGFLALVVVRLSKQLSVRVEHILIACTRVAVNLCPSQAADVQHTLHEDVVPSNGLFESFALRRLPPVVAVIGPNGMYQSAPPRKPSRLRTDPMSSYVFHMQFGATTGAFSRALAAMRS